MVSTRLMSFLANSKENTHTHTKKTLILILAQLIWSAFMLTSNHYAPVI